MQSENTFEIFMRGIQDPITSRFSTLVPFEPTTENDKLEIKVLLLKDIGKNFVERCVMVFYNNANIHT